MINKDPVLEDLALLEMTICFHVLYPQEHIERLMPRCAAVEKSRNIADCTCDREAFREGRMRELRERLLKHEGHRAPSGEPR